MPDPKPSPIWTDWNRQPRRAATWVDALAGERVDSAITNTIMWLCFLGGFAAMPVLLFLAAGVAGWATRRFHIRLRDMMEIPSETPQFPTTVKYWDGGFVYGEDYGLTILAEGMVHFQGQHSHFSIPQRPDTRFSWTQKPAGFQWSGLDLTYRLDLFGTKRTVTLKLLASVPNPQRTLRSRFSTLTFKAPLAECLRDWGRTSTQDFEILLPPLHANPEALLRSKWELVPILAFACLGIPFTLIVGYLEKLGPDNSWFRVSQLVGLAASVTAVRLVLWGARYIRLRMRLPRAVARAAQLAAPTTQLAQQSEDESEALHVES